MPLFAVIGFNNKVYWDSNDRNFTEALNLAIDEFYRPVYVDNPIADKYFMADFSEDIDLNLVFTEADGNPMEFSVSVNSNPEAVNAYTTGSFLTIEGTAGNYTETMISVQAVSGENSAANEFLVVSYNPDLFTHMEQGFELKSFPPPFWEIKYNTAADGGLNGANLIDPDPLEETWMRNTPVTQTYGSDYIRSGEGSALIKYWAPEFNWLIMPEMYLSYADYSLDFWIWFTSRPYETKFNVLVHDGTSWNILLSYDGTSPDNFYGSEISLSLSDYNEKTIRIAFVYEYSDGFEVALDDISVTSPSGIDNNSLIPEGIVLHQNYPNPFNPLTDISYSLSEPSDVRLSVFNTKGENVQTLYKGKSAAGLHTFSFDGSDLTSGVYYYRIETSRGGGSVKKMMLLK